LRLIAGDFMKPAINVKLYRVQASDGRGPWRPGLSKYWIDNDSDRPLQLDVLSAFGMDWLKKIPRGWHSGCACRTLAGLMKWFTPVERNRLGALGYVPVSIYPDKIIAENGDQVVFACRAPLSVCAIALPWTFAADPMTHEIERHQRMFS
jgi:hypothetical protein